MREDFASPSGVVRENTGPLFWLHGTESEVRLREYVRRVAESGQGMLTIESRRTKEGRPEDANAGTPRGSCTQRRCW